MDFGIENCAMLMIKSWKLHLKEGIELPNQEKIGMLGETETYKYMVIWEANPNMQK